MAETTEIMALLAEARAARLGASELEASALRLEAQAQALLARDEEPQTDEDGEPLPCSHPTRKALTTMGHRQFICTVCHQILPEDGEEEAPCPTA